jgi:tRNA(Ile)-lysidine synthase
VRRLTAQNLAALDRRLDPASRAPIALALSGGGDSMALLDLTLAWARPRGRSVLALTVDHRLNPDSAAWTAFARAAALAAGARWKGLSWSGQKPATGLPAAARRARHRLLAHAARQADASVMLFGHTADDIAESARMRVQTPALGYFHEWSPSPAWPEGRGLFTLRPLLGVSRAALRQHLTAQRLEWLEDPANQNLRFARARARAALAAEAGSISPHTPAEPPFKLSEGQITAGPFGQINWMRDDLNAMEAAAAARLLGVAVLCASGRASPPRTQALQRVLERARQGGDFIATLAGARIAAAAGQLQLMREAGEAMRGGLAPLALAAGRAGVWDARFEITADSDLIVRPLAGSIARLSKPDRARLAAIPAGIRPSLPALFQGESVSLPAPYGDGPAFAAPLGPARLAAACGLIAHERDISQLTMALAPRSSYVETLALASAHS